MFPDQGSIGLMSAEKPRFDSSTGQGEDVHKSLVSDLDSLGLKYTETEGMYDEPERSVIIFNPSVEQMLSLGKKFGQESVVFIQNGKHMLLYTNGPFEGKYRTTVPEQEPVSTFEEKPENYYTKIPDKGYASINFDFSQDKPPHTLKQAEKGRVHKLTTLGDKTKGVLGLPNLHPDDIFIFMYIDEGNGFHMRGVPFPLDIAFLDQDGGILDVQNMKPEKGTAKAPSGTVHAVEATEGYFIKNGLEPGKIWKSLYNHLKS